MRNQPLTVDPFLPPRLSSAWTPIGSTIAGAAAALLGLAGVLGWVLGVPQFAAVTSGLRHISFDAACTVLLLGMSLALISSAGRGGRRIGFALAWMALIPPISAVTCMAMGWEMPLHGRVLQVTAFPASARSIMGMPATAALVLCAAAILMLDKIAGRNQSPSQWVAAAGAIVGLLGIVGHAFSSNMTHQLREYLIASAHSAAATMALAGGIILARPTLRPAAVFWNGGTAGVIARRLLLPVIAAPLLLAALALWAVQNTLLDGPLAAAVFSLLGVLVLAGLTGWCVSVLARIDARRCRATRDLRHIQHSLVQSRNDLERRVNQRTAELTLKNVELHQRSVQLSRLASELTLAEHRERRRLAHVLHDHLQQLLVSAKLGLELHSRQSGLALPPDLRRVQDLLGECIKSSRELTMELFPPVLAEEGLGAGLRWLAGWMREKHALDVELEADPAAVPATQDLAILLFQSARELLFNIVKHANVKAAQVRLRHSDGTCLELAVCDKGSGFNSSDVLSAHSRGGGFGLFSVRERLELLGGSMMIEASPGCGSSVTLKAPSRQAAAAC